MVGDSRRVTGRSKMSKILDESRDLARNYVGDAINPLTIDLEDENKPCTDNTFLISDPEARHRLAMIIKGEEQVVQVRDILNWPSSLSYRLKALLGALFSPTFMMTCLRLPSYAFFSMEALIFFGLILVPVFLLQSVFYPISRLLFGVLYPAYASYKAVRTRDVKKYVQWMMYWIVFAFFTCIETFTDIFLSWFPFYYEVKVIIVIWLLSPATKGSSTLYRKFVHPALTRRESEIDEYLSQAKEKSYSTMLELGSKGVNYATSVIMQTAIKSMTNLGNAREIVGRFGGDTTDGSHGGEPGPIGHEREHANGVRVDEERFLYNGSGGMDKMRNKRSVSVDSGLQRERIVSYEDRMQPQIIEEGDEMDVSDAESVERRRRPKGGAEGDEIERAKGTKGKKAAKATTGSRLRGRAAIHN